MTRRIAKKIVFGDPGRYSPDQRRRAACIVARDIFRVAIRPALEDGFAWNGPMSLDAVRAQFVRFMADACPATPPATTTAPARFARAART